MEMNESLPITDQSRWEEAEFEWNEKYFYTVSLKVLFGKAQNLHESFQQLRAEVSSKGYTVPPDGLALMEVELFKGRLMCEIMKTNTYDANIYEMERSKFFSTIHKGPFKTIKETAKKLQEHVNGAKGIRPTSTYYWDFRHGPDLVGARADSYVIICRV
ncbi:hypothetical protein K8I28_02530 [bacterium]|nr:hypothetical protein [bacterium]